MGAIGYFAALTMVGGCLHHAESFKDFIQRVLQSIYLMSVIMVAARLLFGEQAQLFNSLCLSIALTMCMVDFEASFDSEQDSSEA